MQPTPAELVAAIVAADDRPRYRIERHAGIANGAICAWIGGRHTPNAANLIALANACGVEIVAKPVDGER